MLSVVVHYCTVLCLLLGPDVLTSKRFYIFVDKKCAFDYINSALEAVTLPSACYYVFYVRYPEELSATLELLQRLVHEYLYLVTIVIVSSSGYLFVVSTVYLKNRMHFCLLTSKYFLLSEILLILTHYMGAKLSILAKKHGKKELMANCYLSTTQ